MSSSIYNLNALQMDVLKEVGNIGAGHAATALSKILYKPVDMRVPHVQLIAFDDVSEFIGGPEQLVIAVFFNVEGDLTGSLFFIMSEDASRKLIRDLFDLPDSDAEAGSEYSEMERSALNEIGNILAGSYLSSLADLTGLSLYPSVPALAFDMAGAILSYGLIQAGQLGDVALIIDTNFIQGEKEVGGRFFFIPDPASLPILFHALGVSMNDHY
jgi:chemotaxis protein CheC